MLEQPLIAKKWQRASQKKQTFGWREPFIGFSRNNYENNLENLKIWESNEVWDNITP